MGLAALPGVARLVASVDACGALHLWSATTGALARRFAEPGARAEPPGHGTMPFRLHLMGLCSGLCTSAASTPRPGHMRWHAACWGQGLVPPPASLPGTGALPKCPESCWHGSAH